MSRPQAWNQRTCHCCAADGAPDQPKAPAYRRLLALLALVVLFAALVLSVLILLPFPVHSQVASLTLTWHASGDDSLTGTATSYDLRYSSTRPDTTSAAAKVSWWAAATVASGLPTPGPSGTAQSVAVAPPGGFLTGRSYYFVLRSTDDAGNQSDWSNVALKSLPDTIPPAPILDLRVQ